MVGGVRGWRVVVGALVAGMTVVSVWVHVWERTSTPQGGAPQYRLAPRTTYVNPFYIDSRLWTVPEIEEWPWWGRFRLTC